MTHIHTILLVCIALLGAIVCLSPLWIAMKLGTLYRQRPVLPWWPVLFLGFLAVISGVLLLVLPRNLWIIPPLQKTVAFLFLTNVLGCVWVAAVIFLRRGRGWSLVKARKVALMVLLPLIAWLDLRFSIILLSPPLIGPEIDESGIDLRHPPETHLQRYEYAKPLCIANRVYYFGFLTWVQYQGNWTFSGKFGDSNGNLAGDFGFKNATWFQWPKVMAVRKAGP